MREMHMLAKQSGLAWHQFTQMGTAATTKLQYPQNSPRDNIAFCMLEFMSSSTILLSCPLGLVPRLTQKMGNPVDDATVHNLELMGVEL